MILAIGDSNMFPACTEQGISRDGNNLVPTFARHAHQPFRCWAKNGASNYWIEHHIEYFLNDDSHAKDTVLLVGWTSVEREEWPWLYDNVSVCSGPDFGMPEAMRSRFEKWKSSITSEWLQERNEFWHDRIYIMHQRLRGLGIKHLFYTTYQSFSKVKFQEDWHDSFFLPYDPNGDMYHYLIKQGISTVEDDKFHFDHRGHGLWADTLYQHAVSSGIL